jgi:TorA maturation chaperone TorD
MSASEVVVARGREELGRRLDEFAGAYTFTSRLLLEPPDLTLLDRIGHPGLLDEWPMTDEKSRHGVRLLLAGAAEGSVPLARDHQRLFVGPGPLLAPPYESVYLSREHLLFEEQTLQVREAYRAFGLVAPALNREPDDHIGLELHFVAEVCLRSLDALDAGDDDRFDATLAAHQSFLTDHLLVWGPTYLDLITEHAQTDFFRGVALLTAGLLAQAKETFASDPS